MQSRKASNRAADEGIRQRHGQSAGASDRDGERNSREKKGSRGKKGLPEKQGAPEKQGLPEKQGAPENRAKKTGLRSC